MKMLARALRASMTVLEKGTPLLARVRSQALRPLLLLVNTVEKISHTLI